MTTGPVLQSRSGGWIDAGSIAEFRGRIAGEAILPGDDGYDAARRIWNANVVRYPGMVVRCAGVADVVAAVKFARAHDIVVAVRGGGHNVGGRALCNDGLVIDLSRMKAVHVDPAARTVRVQGGATLGDVDRETHVFGLAVPAGVVSRTGIAGLTLGGGVGWLVRKYGMTCDNLLACQVVTAEGEVVTASAEENPDLFWALRGGGGNFGVVTSFLYRAHPVSTVLGGMIVYDRADAPDVLRNWRDFIPGAPEELTAYAGLLCTPDGMPATGVLVCYHGDIEEGRQVIEPLLSFGSPLMVDVQPIPFPAMQRLLDDAFPDGTHNYWKSTFVRELSDAAIDRVVEHANRMQSPMSSVVIEYYGGAPGRVGADETAIAVRGAEYDIGIMAQWTDPAETDGHVAWARDTFDSLQPFSTGDVLLNFLGEESQATIQAAFGGNYARLARVKAKYDPTNFFSINQNIRPAA